MSDPLDPLFVAADALACAELDDPERKLSYTDLFRTALLTFMRDAIGCPNCGGTGRVESHEPKMGGEQTSRGSRACPAEHVEIPFLGETIWADPDKCEWRCERVVQWAPALIFDGKPGTNDCDPRYESHFDCGWQPKWAAIKRDE